MRFEDDTGSDNIEDRRGENGFGVGRGSIGIGTLAVALAAGYFFGIDPTVILGLASNLENAPPPRVAAHKPPPGDEAAKEGFPRAPRWAPTSPGRR